MKVFPDKQDDFRLIYINDNAANAPFKFAKNKVSTAKYQWWNFLPKNLMEQFMRAANIYFLIIAMLQVEKENLPICLSDSMILSKSLEYRPLENIQHLGLSYSSWL